MVVLSPYIYNITLYNGHYIRLYPSPLYTHPAPFYSHIITKSFHSNSGWFYTPQFLHMIPALNPYHHQCLGLNFMYKLITFVTNPSNRCIFLL